MPPARLPTPVVPTTRSARRATARTAALAVSSGSAGSGGPGSWLSRRLRDPLVAISVAVLGIAALVILLFVFGVLGTKPITGIVAPVAIPSTIPTNGTILGSPNAPISLTIYEDPQCPACGLFESSVRPFLTGTYIGTGIVKVESKMIAIVDPISGTESHDAAVAALCALDQGKFWPFHDALYANQQTENTGGFARDRLLAIAAKVGLDTAKLSTCLDDPANLATVNANTKAATDAGLTATPTIFVNGVKWQTGSPTWDQLDAEIKGILSPSPSPAPSGLVVGSSPSPAGSPAPGASPSPSASPAANPPGSPLVSPPVSPVASSAPSPTVSSAPSPSVSSAPSPSTP